MNVFELFAKISLDKKQFDNGLDEAKDKAGKVGKAIGGAFEVAAKATAVAVGAAVTGVVALTTQAVNAYAEYEQLAGGVEKIFDQMDNSRIFSDAANAYINLNMSASDYLATINMVGATFSATMGDEKGYETAQQGMQAIADYASGTGRNVDELMDKFTAITRATSSYQSIADQFSGILPATSADFLAQAQAAGFLSDEYTKLTEVPIAEYQQAVSAMLEKGTADLGLAGNTAAESFGTISGSINMTKAAWQNFIVGLGDGSQDIGPLIDNLVTSATTAFGQILPVATRALGGIGEALNIIAPTVAAELPGVISSVLPSVISATNTILSGLVTALPTLLSVVVSVLPSLLDTIISATLSILPMLLTVAVEALSAIGNALIENLPMLITATTELITFIATELCSADNLSAVIQGALLILLAVADGLVANAPQLVEAVVAIIGNLILAIEDSGPQILETIGLLLGAVALSILEMLAAMLDTDLETVGEGLKILWNNIKSALSNIISTVSEKLNNVKNTFSNIFNGIKSTVTSIISGITSGISNGLNNAKNTVTNVLNAIKNTFTNIFNNVKNIVTGAINTIRGVFNFSWSLPHLNLPHISVSGGRAPYGIGGAGSLPSFSIQWYGRGYDEAMLLTKPTIFGMSGNTLLGGGERGGAEAVVGTELLKDMIAGVVRNELEGLNLQVVLDTGVVVGAIAPSMDSELGRLGVQGVRGVY